MTPYTLHYIDRDIVARTALAEARGEGEKGMRAVCHTIKNRVTDKRWANTYVQVCLQPRQFSCWGKRDPNLSVATGADLDDPVYKVAYSIACEVLSGESEDITQAANHYFSTSINPPHWADPEKETVTIYHHRFYKL